MKPERFNEIMENVFEKVRLKSAEKTKEYHENEDRFQHFRKLGRMRDRSTMEVILDCMGKHVISICDMIDSKDHYLLSLWEEKIIDNITYLCLIFAKVCEKQQLLPGENCIELDGTEGYTQDPNTGRIIPPADNGIWDPVVKKWKEEK